MHFLVSIDLDRSIIRFESLLLLLERKATVRKPSKEKTILSPPSRNIVRKLIPVPDSRGAKIEREKSEEEEKC